MIDEMSVSIENNNDVVFVKERFRSYDYVIAIDDESQFPVAYVKVIYNERRGEKRHQLERMIAEIYAIKPRYEAIEGKKCVVRAWSRETRKRAKKPQDTGQLRLFDLAD